MKRKSKLDLDGLQKKFDGILDSFTKENLITWFEKDRESQAELFLNGKSIIVLSTKPQSCLLPNKDFENIIVSPELPCAA